MSPTIELLNGIHIPQLGLGTWAMDDTEAEAAVGFALATGYRHIDTAMMYQNETGIGRAIQNAGIPREDIFITTKLWPTDFRDPEAALERSLERLGLAFVDLYLIHWPTPDMPEDLWHKIERFYQHELARAIGVSNFSITELSALADTKVVPMVNQVKCSPFDFNKPLFAYCQEKKIIFEAYSPLTRGAKLAHPTITALAARYGRTPAQILLRWNIEHGMVTIPKSANKDRIRENAKIFDFTLAPEDVAALDAWS